MAVRDTYSGSFRRIKLKACSPRSVRAKGYDEHLYLVILVFKKQWDKMNSTCNNSVKVDIERHSQLPRVTSALISRTSPLEPAMGKNPLLRDTSQV